MRILMTGGTGLVGKPLSRRLIEQGHEVTVVTRKAPSNGTSGGNIRFVDGDPAKPGPWQAVLTEQDVLINLAGEPVHGRWTDTKKRILRSSRIETTRRLVEALPPDSVTTLISASAVGYYGTHHDETLTESDSPGDDFLALLARDWEAEAMRAGEKGVRVVLARTGIVLSMDGGAMRQMIFPFRLFAGGPVGSGRQWLPWIHIDDLVEAFLFLLERPDLSGPFNMTAPSPVRNREFSTKLGKVLHRPSWLPVPGFALKVTLGEFGSVLVNGQRVIPERLLDAGFSFRYEKLDEALRDLLEIESVRG